MYDCDLDGAGSAVSAIYATEGSRCFVENCRIRRSKNGCFCEPEASARFAKVAMTQADDAIDIIHKGHELHQCPSDLCLMADFTIPPFFDV